MPAEKLTFQAVMRWSDDKCREFLVSMRWPDGIRCPKCGSAEEPYTIHRKATVETSGTRLRPFTPAGLAGGSSPPRWEPSLRIPRFP